MNKYWFKISDLQNKVGTILDGFYDGLLQIKEEETDKIYICAPNELQLIKSEIMEEDINLEITTIVKENQENNIDIIEYLMSKTLESL